MKRLWIAIAVLMLATVGHAGKAEAGYYYSGSHLLEMCESDYVSERNECNAYLAGLADITGTYDDWGDMDSYFCRPAGVTLGQLQKVAIKGLNEKPEELHPTASGLVHNIFYKAFPCD